LFVKFLNIFQNFSIFQSMIGAMDISSLKKILAKNPKSLLFACYADELRRASYQKGDEKQLDEALLVANKGLEANHDFLPGKLARGRILFEKGDFAGAKADLETITERDPFCISAQKLLMEASEKLGKPSKTETYAKILNAFETVNTFKTEKEPDLKPFERRPTAPIAAATPASESASVNAALDSLLAEEDDAEILELLLQAFNNIFEKSQTKDALPPPAAEPIFEKETPKEIPKEIPKEMPKETLPAFQSTSLAVDTPPNIDDIIKEQLISKDENIPDLTSDMESLLAAATPAPALESTSMATTSSASPNLDALINEQLASKDENLPDLTGDIESLLGTASDTATAAATAEPETEPEAEPELVPYVPKKSATPSVDDLIKEQLADKVEDLPDLTGDIESLLTTQQPTQTLADLYLDQGLTQKAIDVYKELLASDPNNIELQTKLALAEARK
jgi:tetratricopeptide (TPR) repeat protein